MSSCAVKVVETFSILRFLCYDICGFFQAGDNVVLTGNLSTLLHCEGRHGLQFSLHTLGSAHKELYLSEPIDPPHAAWPFTDRTVRADLLLVLPYECCV